MRDIEPLIKAGQARTVPELLDSALIVLICFAVAVAFAAAVWLASLGG